MPQVIVLPCVKCGGEKVVTRFVAERDRMDVDRCFRIPEDRDIPEHLRHRCENCGYSWNSPTLDVPRSPSEERE